MADDDDGFTFSGQKHRPGIGIGGGQLTMITNANTMTKHQGDFYCKSCHNKIDGPKKDPESGKEYILCDHCFNKIQGGLKHKSNINCFDRLAHRCGQEEKFEMTKEIWICIICVLISIPMLATAIVFTQQGNGLIGGIFFGVIGLFCMAGLFTCFKYYGVGRTLYFLFCCWVCCEEELEPTIETEVPEKETQDYKEYKREEEAKKNGTFGKEKENNDDEDDGPEIINDDMDLTAPKNAAPAPGK